MEKLIINLTPTGMIPTKEMTPHVPVHPNEFIEQVHEANEIGITMAHLHARDKDGVPTYDPALYQEIMDGVRKHCPDLIICLSLSGRNFKEFEKRSAPIELKPDMGSLTLSSLNFAKQASMNSPDMLQKLAVKMLDYGVKAEMEAFDLGMINYGKYLIKKGLIKPPYYINLFFDNIAGMQSDMTHIGLAIKEIPEGSYCSLGGVGVSQLAVNTHAIASGYGVRVGLEDNIFWDKDKKVLASNIDMVKRIHEIAEIFKRPIMPAKEMGELGFYNKDR